MPRLCRLDWPGITEVSKTYNENKTVETATVHQVQCKVVSLIAALRCVSVVRNRRTHINSTLFWPAFVSRKK